MASSIEDPLRITVLISGSGTNLQALIDAQNAGRLSKPASIVRVISNRKAAYGLERARRAGIQTAYHNLKAYKDRWRRGGGDDDDGKDGTTGGNVNGNSEETDAKARRQYDSDLAQLILRDVPDLVVCAGWMHIFSPECLDPLAARGVDMINLHPALPGQFNGADAIRRAHEQFMSPGGLDKTGIMIHRVIAAVDEGPPVVVRELALRHPRDDDLAALERRVHEAEWEAIVEGTCAALAELWDARVARGR